MKNISLNHQAQQHFQLINEVLPRQLSLILNQEFLLHSVSSCRTTALMSTGGLKQIVWQSPEAAHVF